MAYTYDAAGNRATRTDGTTETGYTYDVAHRLTAVQEGPAGGPLAPVFSAAYDYRTRRLTKTEGGPSGASTAFRYDGRTSFRRVDSIAVDARSLGGAPKGSA